MRQPPGMQQDLVKCSRDTRQWVLDLAANLRRMRGYIRTLCRDVDELRRERNVARNSANSWNTRATAYRSAWEAEEALRMKAEAERDEVIRSNAMWCTVAANFAKQRDDAWKELNKLQPRTPTGDQVSQ